MTFVFDLLHLVSTSNHFAANAIASLMTECSVASVVFDSVWPHRRKPTRLFCHWGSPGKYTGVGCRFHCVYVPHLLHPFICYWTFRLLPCLGYCKQCCNEHWGACILLDHVFLWIYAQEWDCRVILRAGEEGNRGWDGWIASSTQWAWVWANSRR